jgi:hypothetical protein
MYTVAAMNDVATRERLSGPAIRGFLKLAEVWKLTGQEQVDLLGASVSRGTLHNWAGGSVSTLNADQLMRVSFLLGIFEGLQRIWRRAPVEADAWIRRPRPHPPFRGLSPLQFMRDGGIMGLADARAYVDGTTGGPPSRADYTAPPREEL